MLVSLRILIVEDDLDDIELAIDNLEDVGYSCQWQQVQTQAEFLTCLDTPNYDLIIADYYLPTFNGLTALKLLRKSALDIPFIFVSGILDEEIAIESLRAGATDYVFKHRLSKLGPVVERALQEKKEQRQRRLAQEATRQWAHIFEHAEWGIGVTSPDGKTLELMNPAFAKMHGYKVEELMGQPMAKVCVPEYQANLQKQFEMAQQKGHHTFESRHIAKDGAVFPVQINVTSTKDETDQIMYQAINVQNIAKRKQTEERLRQRAAQMALINDIGSKVAAMLELDSLLDQAAHLVQTTFDYYHVALFFIENEFLKLKSIAGSNENLVSPAYTQPLSEGICGWVASHGEKIVANDVRLEPRYIPLIPDQSITQAELCLPIKIAGQTVGVVDIQCIHRHIFVKNTVMAMETLTNQIAVAIDNARLYTAIQKELNERKQTQEALLSSENRFRQVISSISDHIYMTEVKADGLHINHYISPNVEALTGYSYKSFITNWNFWTTIVHPNDRHIAEGQLERLIGGQNSEVEYRMMRADGSMVWVRDSGQVEIKNDSIFIYGIVSDSTARKQMEATLIEERRSLARRVRERTTELSTANAELARATRLKDEFLANMSHELRTPLNAILGMSEVLKLEVYGQLNDQQQKALLHIEEGGRHLLELINDILDLSKIEAGKLDLEIRVLNVEEVCQTSIRFINQLAKEKQIKTSLTIGPAINSIQADNRRLKQILVNLLNNAVKFTPEGGKMGLEVTYDQEHNTIHFTVWDTGIGIRQEHVQRLFTPFVQIDSKLSRQHEGTGLGLSLVARLTEMHSGGVSVKSEVGQGSRFTVSLPIQQAAKLQSDDWSYETLTAAQSEDITPEPPEASVSHTILLAEDNLAYRLSVNDFLQAKGYEVILAQDGLEAVEYAKRDKPDMILMDIQMPNLDGLEAMRRIRADSRLASTPIIALTALGMRGDRERCLAAGANDYLNKPISMVKMLTTIETQLKKTVQEKVNSPE